MRSSVPSDDILADLLAASPAGDAGDHGEAYLRSWRVRFQTTSLEEITTRLTAIWVDQWRDLSTRIFQTEEPWRQPIYVLPSPALSAETVIMDGSPSIVVHHGLMDLVSFAVECDLLCAQANSLVQGSASGDRISQRLDALMRHIFHCHMASPAALPMLSHWLSDDSKKAEYLYLAGAEMFVLLHEAAHIRLDHLSNVVSSTDGGADGFAAWQSRELQADSHALQSVSKGHELLVYGAWIFLWWFSRYQAWQAHYSNYYPTAVVRFRNILDTASTAIDDFSALHQELAGMEGMKEFLDEGRQKPDLDVLNVGALPDVTEATDEMNVILYSLFN